MIPQTHNIYVMTGELIRLTFGYDVDVTSEELFACIRLKLDSTDFIEKFLITVDKENLVEGGINYVDMAV